MHNRNMGTTISLHTRPFFMASDTGSKLSCFTNI
nr:MAG TPA: hypothetical protein [Caudoviricetes sp.]